MKVQKTTLLILVSWLMVILFLGSQQAMDSNQLSKDLAKLVLGMSSDFGFELEHSVDVMNRLLRDGAHFGIYFVMSVLMASFLHKSGIRGVRCALIAFTLTTFLAISDEVRQVFVPGRGAELKDVMMDAKGALLGAVIFFLSRIRIRKISTKSNGNNLVASGILESSQVNKYIRAH